MAVLTQGQYQTIRAKAIGVADMLLQGRKVISPITVDEGTQEYGYDKLTDMSAAEIISKYAPGSRDKVDLTRKTKGVPILHKGFMVSRIDLKSSQKSGQPLKTVGLGRATRKVAELEDTIIIKGDSNFNIDGIDTIVGNTYTGGLNWGSGTPTDAVNPYTDILNAAATLEVDGFEAKFLLLHPTNHAEAAKKVTGAVGTWLDMIKEIVPNVLKTTAVTEGTFYAGDMGEDIAELVIAENYEVLDPNNGDQMVYNFDIIDRVLPMFYEYGSVSGKSDAFVKGSGI